MNDARSARYHKARRRTGLWIGAVTAAVLSAVLLTGASGRLAAAAGGSAGAHMLVLSLLSTCATLPLAWYRGCRLERDYGLSDLHTTSWAAAHAKTAAVAAALAAIAAELLYLLMRAWPDGWWALAAASGAAATVALTSVAPLVVVPLFHAVTPLRDRRLHDRLLGLAARAGVPVLAIEEWGWGARTRRAGAAVVGLGSTRRVLLSDTLLSGYSPAEIEAVLAHELGHHVHRDVPAALAAEAVILCAGFFAADRALAAAWGPLRLASPADPGGLPLVLLVLGAVFALSTPLLNALSRFSERRADGFAVALTSRPDDVAAAIRRMAADNLAEEHPSRAAYWFYHTHPTVPERLEAVSKEGAARRRGTR